MSVKYRVLKAQATRKARNTFFETYPDTAYMARDLLQGKKTDEELQDYYFVTREQLAAVKAHLNRYGKFSELAYACNF